ncbi:hypothetical protein ACH4SP_41910 [Streptomyces sp. NPDC021093]|uniref:hypothetical protein n=1 Tax=Streptomyces sp. NPDC021093 TaxID=3365112 RepID=UPI003787DB5E
MQRTTRQTPIRTQLPTPTVAQCTYGAMTAVFSTLAMLLLSQTTSGAWIAVIACAALGLGLLVAMTVPMPLVKKAARGARTRTSPTAASVPAATAEAYDGVRVPGPRARSSASSASSVGEHSLRG